MTWLDSHYMRLTEYDTRVQSYTSMPQVNLLTAGNLFFALFDNNVTPDKDALTTLSAYTGTTSTFQAAGGATGTNQVFQVGQWAQGGIVVPSPTMAVFAGGIVQFSSGALQSGAAATMSNIYGGIHYFTLATGGGQTKPILGYWYFGGTPFGVTSGLLTITPNANGWSRVTT